MMIQSRELISDFEKNLLCVLCFCTLPFASLGFPRSTWQVSPDSICVYRLQGPTSNILGILIHAPHHPHPHHSESSMIIVVNVTMVRTACHECYEARSPREIIYADTLIYVGMGLQFATSYINCLGLDRTTFPYYPMYKKHCHLPLKLFILWSCDVFNFWPVDFCSIDGLDCTKKTCYLSHLKLPSTDWSHKCRVLFFSPAKILKDKYPWQKKLGGNKSMKNSLPKSKKGPSGPQPTLEGT